MGNEIKAPYNFVPFSDKILIRYAFKKDLPRHDRIDQTLKSGEIHFTMTAKTPVFVSDGNKDEKGELHFFQGANGKYRIPGSTIRGMVRANMQILGFGLIRTGEDIEKNIKIRSRGKPVLVPLIRGLPEQHREKQENKLNKEEPVLDYPYSILGYAGDKSAYRSRVSFGDMELQGEGEEEKLISTILGEPKPSYFPCYVKDGKRYGEDGFELRGHKLYWLKDTNRGKLPKSKNPNMDAKLRPLPVGSVFTGVIRFKNLHEDELGLLLWCLRLKKGYYQSIGMGKPYGFGRMKPVVDDLLEYDFTAMYRPDGLSAAPVSRKDQIGSYIEKYTDFAAGELHIKKPEKPKNSPLENQDEIQDFLYLRSTIRAYEDVDYMKLKEYAKHKNSGKFLPSVQTIREGWRTKLLKRNNGL